MRETAAAILADTFDVISMSDDGPLRTSQAPDRPALVIVGTESLPIGLPPEVPIVWLSPRRNWVPPLSSNRSVTLSRQFVPPELRTAVQQALIAPRFTPRSDSLSRLAHPFLALPAVSIAAQAVRTALPVLIVGPRGTGRGALAQALHRESGGGSFVALSGLSIAPTTAPASASGTIFIDRIERLRPEQQDYLSSVLQPDGSYCGRDGQRLRVIAGTEADTDAIIQDADFSSELFYRLSVLSLPLVPLRDRPQDIPALVQALGSALAPAFDIAALSFTPRALERLSNYLWFGDLAELEGVLARTLVLCRKEMIDADDLCFALADTARTSPSAAHRTEPARNKAVMHSHALDLVINEVAHEIKNPLVTIKTFAQHLRRQGAEGSEEQQLARLTGDAVDEIDSTVENLVQFTQLEEPLRESVALQAVLAPAVALLTQLVRPRTRRVDYRPPPAVSITVDRAQVIYGLSNLFRALARGLGDTGRIVVGYEDPGRIVLELPTGFNPSDAHLAAMLGEPRPSGPTSLAGSIAQQVLERNGGVLAFETQRQPPRVTVQFPLSLTEEVPLARNAQTPRVGR